MWYRNGKRYYSISEKINYYKTMSESSNSTLRRKASNNLNRLYSIISNKSIGHVFVVKAREFDTSAHSNKTRRVVLVNSKVGKLTVVPVLKNKNMLSLSGFDGDRSININLKKDLSTSSIYENRSFKNNSNDRLNKSEINKLKKIVIKKNSR